MKGCPAWCTRCGLGEHRGDPVRIPGLRAVVTPVQPHGGLMFAELRANWPLPGRPADQWARLVRLLSGWAELIEREQAAGRRPVERKGIGR